MCFRMGKWLRMASRWLRIDFRKIGVLVLGMVVKSIIGDSERWEFLGVGVYK